MIQAKIPETERVIFEFEDLGRFEADVTISFDETHTVEVSDHPVEDSEPMSDNAELKPSTFSVEIWMGEIEWQSSSYYGYSIEQLQEALKNMPDLGPDKAWKQRFDLLMQARRQIKRLQLITDTGTYKNCVILSIGTGFSDKKGKTITLSLKQAKIATTEVTEVPEVKLSKGADLKFGDDQKQKDRHGPAGTQGRTPAQPAKPTATKKQAAVSAAWSGAA